MALPLLVLVPVLLRQDPYQVPTKDAEHVDPLEPTAVVWPPRFWEAALVGALPDACVAGGAGEALELEGCVAVVDGLRRVAMHR